MIFSFKITQNFLEVVAHFKYILTQQEFISLYNFCMYALSDVTEQTHLLLAELTVPHWLVYSPNATWRVYPTVELNGFLWINNINKPVVGDKQYITRTPDGLPHFFQTIVLLQLYIFRMIL